MTLAHGRTYLAIPGPSVVPDRVLNAMHAAAPNIYEGALVDMVHGSYRTFGRWRAPTATWRSTSPTATAPGRLRRRTW